MFKPTGMSIFSAGISRLNFASKKMTQVEKRASMLLLVNQRIESGLSQAKFAAQHNLTLVKFRYWIHNLKPDNQSDSAFIQLTGFSKQAISQRYPNGVELLLHLQTLVCALNLTGPNSSIIEGLRGFQIERLPYQSIK
jgi:hypothetical protein